jgi:hypothetical protein
MSMVLSSKSKSGKKQTVDSAKAANSTKAAGTAKKIASAVRQETAPRTFVSEVPQAAAQKTTGTIEVPAEGSTESAVIHEETAQQ